MAAFVKRMIAATCLLFIAGCVTDEVVVYKDHAITKEAAKRFLGEYEVQEWIGNTRPETVRVAATDGKLSFAYSTEDEKVDVNFELSKIPSSKKGLFVLSISDQEDTGKSNIFFIGNADKEQTNIWVVLPTSPVAKDHLEFSEGKAKDVKTFLVKHADAYVAANEAQIKLKHGKR